MKGHQNCIIGSKEMALLLNLLNWFKDYSTLLHFRNCNLTSESPQFFTRRPQTPDKVIGIQCAKCAKQEVLDGLLYWVSVVSAHGQDKRHMCAISMSLNKIIINLLF